MLVDLDVTKFKTRESLGDEELYRRLTQLMYELNEMFERIDKRLLPDPEQEKNTGYLETETWSPFRVEQSEGQEQILKNLTEEIVNNNTFKTIVEGGTGEALPEGTFSGDRIVWDGEIDEWVVKNAPTSNNVLAYWDSMAQEWKYLEPTTTDEIIRFDGTDWKTVVFPDGSSSGEFLYWDGSKWAVHSVTAGGLLYWSGTDWVFETGSSAGDLLQWDGSSWSSITLSSLVNTDDPGDILQLQFKINTSNEVEVSYIPPKLNVNTSGEIELAQGTGTRLTQPIGTCAP